MSIYIKGMEMPTSCLHGGCPIDGESCSLWEEKHWESPDEPYRKRHPKCPIVPVPPHGRLIDADALTKSLFYYFEKSGGRDTLEALIRTEPTIIEAEEVYE